MDTTIYNHTIDSETYFKLLTRWKLDNPLVDCLDIYHNTRVAARKLQAALDIRAKRERPKTLINKEQEFIVIFTNCGPMQLREDASRPDHQASEIKYLLSYRKLGSLKVVLVRSLEGNSRVATITSPLMHSRASSRIITDTTDND